MSRWTYDRLAREWDWRTRNILDLRMGGATAEEEQPLRDERDDMFDRAGWTDAEFTQQLEKRLDRYFAKEARAKAREEA